MTKHTVVTKLKAKRLYVNKLYTALDISRKIAVTEKTLRNWIKEGNWLEAREAVALKIVGQQPPAIPEIIVYDLLEFIKENAPHLAKKVQPIVHEYLNQLNQ